MRLLGRTDGSEREEPPFTNVLEDLLRLPAREGLATLVLLDEVLMWARTKADTDPAWRHRLQDFFQCLTQAATKVDTCAVVASLLAADPHRSDTLGKEITRDLYAVFRREQEEPVEPVVKEDVAEVLCRRFFTPDSIRSRDAFRPHVVAALKGIMALDEQTRKDGKAAEDRFFKSYPFHPDLTEVFYTKWTNLEGFQRTRGILRTFALGLRDAERWDECPLVGANVFLSPPGEEAVSEAARDLTTVAATEEHEGKKQEWAGIPAGELSKAREVQRETTGMRFREIEQAVFATFLHSQPIGHRALPRELLLLLGPTQPDKIEVEKALAQWFDTSWFLDEAAADPDAALDGQKRPPKFWRLGSRPNLKQMHHDACLTRVPGELVEATLLSEIGKVRGLTTGASAGGARVHNLPERPRDIEDDGEFHYAILGPKAASDSGKPSTEARRFLDEKTGPDSPRVFRNAVVLVTPSRDGLEVARGRIREYLGWLEVEEQLKGQHVDTVRLGTLHANRDAARKKISEAVQQAYCIVVTVSDKNDVQAFKIAVGSDPLFHQIKSDPRSRIQDTAVSADALLPEGPYNLWRAGETSRRAKDLVGAFAQFPHLPKMLNRKAILDTVLGGCREGLFVLQLTRPDRSVKTFWREEPDTVALNDPSLEVVLPDAATLTELSPTLLAPGEFPGLWNNSALPLAALRQYFSGGHVVNVPRDGYEEPLILPSAEQSVIDAAVQASVLSGKLWLTSGPASLLKEEVRADLLTEDARLHEPPSPIPVMDVLPEHLPDAWPTDTTTATAVLTALSSRAGQPLPWSTVREALHAAVSGRWLELAPDSAPWSQHYTGAHAIKLRRPIAAPSSEGVAEMPGRSPEAMHDRQPPSSIPSAEAVISAYELQELGENVGGLLKAAEGYGLRFHLRVELVGENRPPDQVIANVNQLLKAISDDLHL